MPHAKPILPNVIVIGAMKAGTTSLFEYMAGHKEIGVSSEKETDFFVAEKNWPRGLDWYQGLFQPGYRIYAEASPNYTKRSVFPGVPERIAKTIPNCRFIFISRDPVARARSQYRHAVLSGANVPAVDALEGSHTFHHLVDTSSYAAQLRPYLNLFPAENFLFLRFEDLVQNPENVLSKVAEFLDVIDQWPSAEEVANNSAESLSRLPLWLFRLRETRFASALKSILPRAAINRAKQLVSSGKSREADAFPEHLSQLIDEATREDAVEYTRLESGVYSGFFK